MAVKVTTKKHSSVNTESVTHERGRAYAVKDGDLYVFSSGSQAPSDQVAVHARDTWLSAVVDNS